MQFLAIIKATPEAKTQAGYALFGPQSGKIFIEKLELGIRQYPVRLVTIFTKGEKQMPKRIYGTSKESYKVVINHEEQYSLIPIKQTLTKGLRDVGKSGTANECMNYIEEVWTDMTPTDKQRILKSIGL